MVETIHFIHLKRKYMPSHNRSIGGSNLEQGGPNLGNDYSRDISREVSSETSNPVVVPHNQEKDQHHKEELKRKQEQQKREQEQKEQQRKDSL
jgi:hypothetical protein